MLKNKISVWLMVLVLSCTCIFSVLPAYAVETPEPSASASRESGITRGSNADEDEPRESGITRGSSADEDEPGESPAPSAGTSGSGEEDSEPTPTPTANPRLNEDGTPKFSEEECAVLINCLNGEVMLEQNKDKRIYPASTTKIMTALLTLEAIEREELSLEASFLIMPEMLEDLPADGSSMKLKEGEAMTVRYLLEGLMVESGNDAAQALAIIVCGDVPTFVERMNNRAAELGMSGTHFMNPHGLHDDEHYTTASDLGKLTVEAMKNNTFREIVAMPQAVIPQTEMSGRRTFTNTNGLLSTLRYSDYYYQNAIGVKTGHTSQAGYCLVSAAKQGDLEVVGVLMNSASEDDRHYNSRNMLSYALDNFKAVKALSKGDMVSEIKVKFGSGTDHTTLSVSEDVYVTIPADASAEELTVEPVTDEDIPAPVNSGDKVGTVNIVLNGETVGTADLTADITVKKHPLGFIMQFFSYIWSFTAVKVIVIAVLILLIIFIVYMAVNIRRNIKIAERQRRASRKRRPRR